MSEERRFIRVPIYIDPAAPATCHMSSFGCGGDGCAAFHYDDDGDAFCGAFGKMLYPVDEDANDEFTPHTRCDACLMNELTQ